ncbi:MAG: ABC transporter ATP-binding protein/permease [Oscillospiraceae bacterium]|nr:ABC transporter ATP-binding protein/permease [Oscillospiraceae bacterium]
MKEKRRVQLDDMISSFREIWKYDKRLFLILLVTVFINALRPFPNIILSGLIIDSISQKEAYSQIVFYVLLMFGSIFVLEAISIYLGKIKEYLFLKFTNKLNNDISQKCLNMDYEQFNDTSFQDSIQLTNQIAQGNNYFTSITTVFDTLSNIISLIGIVAIMTMLNKWLFLIAVVLIGLQSVLQIVRQKYNLQFQNDSSREQRRLGYVSQIPKNIPAKKDIDMFDLRKYVFSKIEHFQKNILSLNLCRIKKDGVINLATFLLTTIFQISAYLLIGIDALKGTISVGEFTMGVASLISFMSAFSYVATNMLNFNNSLSYIHMYKSFLTYESKFDDDKGLTLEDLNLDDIEIEFKNVSFRYPNSTSYVLKNINLKLSSKEKLAIVGYNGAGKTTFTLLLTRMYEPTEGEILLNGINIQKINYRDNLKIFSAVNQDFFLFPFTILENVAGKSEVTDEEKEKLMELCRSVGMEERIGRMYRGLDTPITKELFAAGIDLSGGERQKIAILRSLYKDSPVLILDEPTAALDPIAECEIYRNFADISDGKLTVYISHRINSTRFCDKIAVFDHGQIKEYGTFEELMNLHGLYYTFFETQAEMYVRGNE